MLDKKKIWTVFLFEFKMDCRAVERARNINNAFGPGTAHECTVQWWFKKFCKGDESLEVEECSHQPSEIGNDSWEPSPKVIFLKLCEKLQNSVLTILQSFCIWSKLERWKSSISVCLMSWLGTYELTANQRNHCFEVSSSLILHSNNEPFLDLVVMCVEKWTLYDNWWRPAPVVGVKRSSKALPKAKPAPRKKDYGHSLLVCCQPGPLQLSESWLSHCILEVCSANQWHKQKTARPAASIG